MDKHEKILAEIFGDPLNVSSLDPIEVSNELGDIEEVCPDCGMMPINGRCGCAAKENGVCPICGMFPIDGQCGCKSTKLPSSLPDESQESSSGCGCSGMNQGSCVCEAKRKGPSKKTAKKILRGTKTFAQK